ncbi:glycoside hydrolase [Nannochloropsis oceanica]
MAAARVVPRSLKLWPGALFALGMGGAAGTYRYQTDEGTRRSVYFWSRAFPIYLHYRYVKSQVQHLPEAEQEEAYKPLHEKYAPTAVDIVLHLKGFYIKIAQVGSTRADL